MCVVMILGLQSRFPLLFALPVYVLRPRISCPEEHWLLVYDCFHVLVFATWAIHPDQKAKLLFLEYLQLSPLPFLRIFSRFNRQPYYLFWQSTRIKRARDEMQGLRPPR